MGTRGHQLSSLKSRPGGTWRHDVSESLVLVMLSGLAGLMGLLVNVGLARWMGAGGLGTVVRLFGLVIVMGFPGSLIGLQLAQFIARRQDWKHIVRKLQWLALAVGMMWVMLLETIGIPGLLIGATLDHSEGVVIMLLVMPAFVPAVQYAAALGRGRYVAMAWIAFTPVVLRSSFIGLLALGLWSISINSVLWVSVAALWVSLIVNSVIVERISHEKANDIRVPGWVSLTLIGGLQTAWLSWDVVWATRWLAPSAVGLFGVVATLGKVPFHLLSSLANRGIGENFWGRSKRGVYWVMVLAVGIACVLGLTILWNPIASLFRLPTDNASLRWSALLYIFNAMALALWYHDAVVSLKTLPYRWIGAAVLLGAWTVFLPVMKLGVGRLTTVDACLGLGVASVAGWIAMLV